MDSKLSLKGNGTFQTHNTGNLNYIYFHCVTPRQSRVRSFRYPQAIRRSTKTVTCFYRLRLKILKTPDDTQLFSESTMRSPEASPEDVQTNIYPDDEALHSVRFSNGHDNVNAWELHQNMGFKIAKENGTTQLENIQTETSPETEMFFLE